MPCSSPTPSTRVGCLWTREALQRLLEMAVKETDAFKVWVSNLRREIDSNETSNFIVDDGRVHS
jgi:hypothetical protein